MPRPKEFSFDDGRSYAPGVNFTGSDAVDDGIGLPSDSAWLGTGNATLVSSLKGVFDQRTLAVELLTDIYDNTWSPSALGSSLIDMWDAEKPATLTLSGAAVSAWASAKNGYSAAQAVSASKPIYSATGFNGRANVDFDGADDSLTYSGVGVLPVGASPCEIWALVDQQALAADTSPRCIIGYGGDVAGISRRLVRAVVGGINRAQMVVGNGGINTVTITDTDTDLSGNHVIRAQFGATTASLSVDGGAPTTAPAIPNTSDVRTRIGAINFNTAQSFWNGGIPFVAITTPLSTDQAAKMLNYLKNRGGIA